MRLLYSIAWWVALPAVFLRLIWRGRKEPGYRRHLLERFGVYARVPLVPRIWVHAVSVGETRAAQPLVEALLAAYPDHHVLLTHMTATGRDTGAAVFARHGARVRQCYLPYDTGLMTKRFLRHFRPRLCVLMETEVWPNLIAQCRYAKVPVALMNARLSARSLRKAERLGGLIREAAENLGCAGAQTQEDAQRLRQLGVPHVRITGSIKFDITPPVAMTALGAQLRAQCGDRKILLCGSTREGEERLILDAWRAARPTGALLVIVPRHPQRFDEVATQIAALGFGMQRRSALGEKNLAPDVDVLLGDSMGEMFAYYAAADLAFIGGSLLPLGGQNLIEACAVGTPVLIGPHTFNFSAVTDNAIAAGAAWRVADAQAMARLAGELLGDDTQRVHMSEQAAQFARQHRGATTKSVELLQPLLLQS